MQTAHLVKSTIRFVSSMGFDGHGKKSAAAIKGDAPEVAIVHADVAGSTRSLQLDAALTHKRLSGLFLRLENLPIRTRENWSKSGEMRRLCGSLKSIMPSLPASSFN